MSSRRAILALTLLFPIAILSYGAFAAVTDAVLVPGASIFIAPTLWFLGLFTVFMLGAVLWQEMLFRSIAAVLLMLPSLFFVPTYVHASVVLFASVLAFAGTLRVAQELRSRLHLSVYRSAGAGMSLVLFAVTLVISSQYYVHVGSLSWQRLVPNFDLGEGTGAWMIRMASNVSPSLKALQNDEISVDSFLNQLREKDTRELPELDPLLVEKVQWAEVAQSKKELSRLLGREVQGDENMNAILSEVLRKKTVAFISSGDEQNNLPVPLLPFFLSVLLFFTIYPLGAFLAPAMLGLTAALFALCVRFHVVTLRKIPAERDIIV